MKIILTGAEVNRAINDWLRKMGVELDDDFLELDDEVTLAIKPSRQILPNQTIYRPTYR